MIEWLFLQSILSVLAWLLGQGSKAAIVLDSDHENNGVNYGSPEKVPVCENKICSCNIFFYKIYQFLHQTKLFENSHLSFPFDILFISNEFCRQTIASKTVKFIYSEKATKFCKISSLLLSYVVPVKSKVEIQQDFVVFSEYMNFKY